MGFCIHIMFLHKHPYQPFIPEDATKLIVGSLPPPRFSINQLLDEDVNFCYGSKHGLLWPILSVIFNLNLQFSNTTSAINQRKEFLYKNNIGICDLVESCERIKVDASDLGMNNIKLRDLINYLSDFKNINTLIFMGGNTKNGPEYLFRKLLKSYNIAFSRSNNITPRVHSFQLKNRTIKTISLISPSNAANRSIGSNSDYKKMKSKNSSFTTLDFRLRQYHKVFIN